MPPANPQQASVYQKHPPTPQLPLMSDYCQLPVGVSGLHRGRLGSLGMPAHCCIPGGFYSVYSLVTKKTSGFLPILDLQRLNKYLKTLHF